MKPSRRLPRRTPIILGAVILSTIALFFLYTRSDRAESATADASPLASSEALRAQADRLYVRAVSELASGDTAEAKVIAPIALRAYEDAGDLDADGMYHAVVLLTAMGAYDQAREAADQVLAEIPEHLIVLAAAARAARLQADTPAARDYYGRFLGAYDAEPIADGSPDPHGHRATLAESRDEAEAFTSVSGGVGRGE